MQAKKRSMRVIAACGLLSAIWASGMTAAGKPSPSTPVATFWFEEGRDVSGDSLGIVSPSTISVYQDYHLTNGDVNGVNYCVEASPATTGLFIRLNRNLDGDSGNQPCQQTVGRTQAQRDMTLHISSTDACNELLANAPAGYAVADEQGGCRFGHFDRPRIRISSDLYAKRTTSTAVDFLEKSYDDFAVSYEVQSDTNAAVIVDPDPARRTVRSQTGATAHLVKFVPGGKPVNVAGSFPLSFSIVIVRSPGI